MGCVGDTQTDAEVFFVVYTDRTRGEIEAELDQIVRKLEPVMDAAQVTTGGFEAASPVSYTHLDVYKRQM